MPKLFPKSKRTNLFFYPEKYLNTKAKSNYRGYNRKSSNPFFFVHFFIDNSDANTSLYTLSCFKLKFGQLKVYKLVFALELSNIYEKTNKKNLDCWVFGYTRL